MKKALLLLLWVISQTALGQENKPLDPNIPPPLLPLNTEQKTPTINAGNTPSGFSPVAPPEVAFANRFKDIPVNLYTGTPIINFPLYTLSEAGVSVPISLNYNSSGMKAHEVPTWCGIGWSLNAGGMITRVVQDVPDEGKLELTSLNSNTFNHLKGYYYYGNSTMSDNNDHEADIYYLNVGGASYKFMYMNRGGSSRFVFFPDADIDVQMQATYVSGSTIVRTVTKWVITMPDGMKYEFGSASEQSAEVEVKYAQTNDVTPWNTKFSRYWKTNAVTSAWYLTKIISPHGHEIVFNYIPSSYSFFRLAENEANGVCPNPTDVEKKINRVYVHTNTLTNIQSRTVKVEFNKEKLDCNYINPETGETECNLDPTSIPSRQDIDTFLGGPNSKSDAKKLVEMTVMDNVATPTDTLKYRFEYDHFVSADSTNSALPSPYTLTDVGKSHTRRLRLKQINLPDSTHYQFNYYFENAPTTFYSRLTYGIDHWGFLNGWTGNKSATGLIPKDYHFSTCTPNTSNRETDSLYAKYGLIEKITVSTGNQITFDYEAHKAENYKNGSNYIPIGGSRISQINQKDLISGIETIKKYTYKTEDSTKSSGFLVMKPIYRFHNSLTPYVNSGLYDFLMNLTGRPAVAYSHVTEKITTNANENVGFTTYNFDVDAIEKTIKTTSTSYPYDTVFRAETFFPEHDFIGGTLLNTKVYNADRKVISQQINTSNISYYDYSFSTYGTRVIRFNNQYLSQGFGTYFRKYRPKTTENITYSQTGTTPVSTKTTLTYKDELYGSYWTKYPGKHNFVVKTETRDVDGYYYQTYNRYIADYDFKRDTTVCTDPDDINTCDTYSLLPAGSDAEAIYEMRANHLLSPIVETITYKLGLISATYNSYGAFNSITNPFKYQLRSVFQTDSLGKNSIPESYYSIGVHDIKKDLSYYSVVEFLEYNPIGLLVKSKPLAGAISKISYDPLNVLPIEQKQNDGGTAQLKSTTEYAVKIFGVSKHISPNLLEVRNKYYADGRPKQTEDKDGFLLSHYEYRYKGQNLLSSAGSFTTDTSKNRVILRSPRMATTNPYQNVESVTTMVNYGDGEGRALQAVGYKISPSKKDIVSNTNHFDSFGRPSKSFLPVGNLSSNGNYQSNILPLAQAFYENDSIPFTQVKQYEASPLSRMFKAFGVGGAFRPNAFAEQKYETGNYSVQRYYYQTNSDILQSGGFYYGNELLRESSIDERGNKVRILTDKFGNLREKHIQYTGDGTQESDYLKTAYAYDELGRLAIIIPPKIFNFNVTQISAVSNSIYTKGLYIFKYDHRGRIVAKHTPDAGWTHMVYNQQNQVVMSQNARHRQESLWLYSKFDAYGRNIISGVVRLNKTKDTLQKYFDLYGETNQYEESTQTVFNGTASCYTNRSFPSSIILPDSTIMTISFFDDYSWKSNDTLNFKLYKHARYTNASGLSTGNAVRNLKTKQWLRTVLYYDDKNRLIQSQNENRYGLVNQTDNEYDFIGQLLEERTIYRKPSQTDVSSKTKYLYDHVGRKIQAIHQLNNNPPEVLASYEYDEIGRMVQKNLNEAQKDSIIRANESLNKSVVDVAKKYILLKPGTIINHDSTYYAFIGAGLQKVTYQYNIRGYIVGINLTPAGRLDSSKLFSLKLDYHEDGRYLDGNLSQQQWKTHRDTVTRKFVYDYDKVNRITGATFTGKGSENYSLSNLNYDANGNIKTLTRKGFIAANNWNTIDNLTYAYTNPFTAPNDVSNRLFQVQDAIGTSVGIGDFKNGASTLDEYLYYDDGSLKTDLNKGIDSIKYNYIGLPTYIYFDPDKYIENIYTADGVKLSQKIVNGSSIIQTDYIGDLLYRNDTLVSVSHGEGKIRFDTLGKAHYQFFITDHLGNTRVIFEKLNDSTYIAQENHYGAWGEILQGIGTSGNWKFLFQGKEYIDAFGYNSYDFHARGYDSNIGRFDGIDPVDNYSLGGYVGMMNNPTAYVDPDGQNPVLIGAAFVGGFMNFTIDLARNRINSFGDALLSFGKGAVFGLLSGNPASAAVNSLSSLLPSVNVPIGNNFSVSLNPAIAFGSNGFNVGANLGVNYSSKNFSAGVGFGAGYTKMKLDANTAKGFSTTLGGGFTLGNDKWNVGLYTTKFSGAGIGQKVGGFRLTLGGVYAAYENDYAPFDLLGEGIQGILNDKGDRFRTNAVSLGYGDFDIRVNQFTGDSHDMVEPPSEGYPFGIKTGDGDMYRLGALSLGYKGHRIGWNNEPIRDYFQNYIAHTKIRPQAYFRRLPSGYPGSLYTSTTGFKNRYSLWTF